MPEGTCDPATRGETFNTATLEQPLPDGSGSVLVDVRFGWDGVSARPDCDGPVQSLRTRNTGSMPAWALLSAKKRGDPWVRIDPGTDATVSGTGALRNLGLSNYSDVGAVTLVFSDPAAP